MPLQTSGTISINDLRNEFGNTPGQDGLNEYYRGGSYVPNIPQNNNVPTSGQIALSNFYGAMKGYPLNVVISGGGGGGGGGYNDGSGNNRPATAGGSSWVRNTSGNNVVSVSGGNAGSSGNRSGTTGGNGQNSPINANGRGNGGNANNSGNSSTRTSWGASGGGGGGDSGGKNDSAGNAGNGGGRGSSASGSYVAINQYVNIRTGAGGAGRTNGVPQNGGTGSPGYVRIRGGRSGDRTFTVNGRATGNWNSGYRVF
jgi:hypothetical protein